MPMSRHADWHRQAFLGVFVTFCASQRAGRSTLLFCFARSDGNMCARASEYPGLPLRVAFEIRIQSFSPPLLQPYQLLFWVIPGQPSYQREHALARIQLIAVHDSVQRQS